MTSSIVSIPSGTLGKEDLTFRKPAEAEPKCKQRRESCSQLTDCGLLAKRCFGEKVRPSAGLCMIAFAVPLIVPGITLTVVAFEEDTGFSKYGALHILGFVLLLLAVVLTTTGIVLNTQFQSQKISYKFARKLPDDEKTINDADLVTVISSNTTENHHKNNALATVFIPGLPSFSHVDKTQENSAEVKNKTPNTTAEISTHPNNNGQKRVSFSNRRGSKRLFSSNKSFDDYSSSFDSFDSEDFSSGSYILSDEPGLDRPIPELEIETDTAQDINEFKFPTFRPEEDQFTKQVFSFDDINSYSNCASRDKSQKDDATNLNEINTDSTQSQPDSSKSKIDRICSGLPEEITEITKGISSVVPEQQEEENSPGSRQRLYGLSSDMSVESSDSHIASRDSLKANDLVLKDSSDSNSSVFMLERLTKPAGDARQENTSTEVVIDHSFKPNQLKTWAQSPPTKRPNSFPCGTELSGPSDEALRNNSLKEKHITSLDEFSR